MPLLSLIEDNINFVLSLGIPAVSLSTGNNSKTEENRVSNYYKEIRTGKYQLVYTTPEKLVKSPGFLNTIDYLYSCNKIDRFVIDEVHCVSHWG
jgi:superfamily II DNA helicase RecQ